MNKTFIFIIISILFISLSACSEDDSASSISTEKILYDIETITEFVEVENGVNKSLATFVLHIENESQEENLFLKQINFSLLELYGGEMEELEFYDALDNFKIIINGTEIIPALERANIILPKFEIALKKVMVIEVRADVKSQLPNIKGVIRVDRIFIIKKDGTNESYPENLEFAPELGDGNFTAMNKTLEDGSIPNWRMPEITIIGACEEDEIRLNDGDCVYNQCEVIFCNYGDCAMNLNSGAADCLCFEGYEKYPEYFTCDNRVAKFDIETTYAEMPVTNNTTGHLIAEWQIFINEKEKGELKSLYLELEGAKYSFSNFKIGFLHPQYGNIQFGEIQNENPNNFYDDMDSMHIGFNYLEDEGSQFELIKNSIITIKLYADVHGNSGDSLEVKIRNARIISKEINGNFGTLPLEVLYSVGNSSLYSAVYNSGYLHQWNPTATIQ